jgi:hypothetical protein
MWQAMKVGFGSVIGMAVGVVTLVAGFLLVTGGWDSVKNEAENIREKL